MKLGYIFVSSQEKLLASASEKSAPGMKASKDRVTLMAFSNATGTHKLRLVIIGKL